MNKSHLPVLVFAILLLFLIQSAGTLVESIYILDLLNTSLDEKALGILFFFSPLLALPFFRKFPRDLAWFLFGILLLGRGLTPSLSTSLRLLSSGISTGAAFGLLFLLLAGRSIGSQKAQSAWGAAGLALAVALSTLLRAGGNGIEYSLTPAGAWTGWLLAILLGLCLFQLEWKPPVAQSTPGGSVTLPILGVYLVLTLVYFAFSAPAVIARWTQGNYLLIVAFVSLLSLGWVWLSLRFPGWMDRLSPRLLLAWNLLFTLALTRTLLVQRVAFPPTLESPAVVVGLPTFWQQLPLYVMLLLFPVLFIDLRLFLGQIQQTRQQETQSGDFRQRVEVHCAVVAVDNHLAVLQPRVGQVNRSHDRGHAHGSRENRDVRIAGAAHGDQPRQFFARNLAQ